MKAYKESNEETKRSKIQKVHKEQSTNGEATMKDDRTESVFQRKLQAVMSSPLPLVYN